MQKYQDVKTLEEFGIRCTCYALNNEVGSMADLLHLRHWRTANVRNVSFRNSLQWPIYVINSVHKTTLSCNTSLLPFPLSLTLSLSHTQKLLDWEFSTLIIPPIFFRISRNHNTLNRYSNRKHGKRNSFTYSDKFSFTSNSSSFSNCMIKNGYLVWPCFIGGSMLTYNAEKQLF